MEKIPWRTRWQPTPVFLPGKSHRQRSLEGLVHRVTESDTTEVTEHMWRDGWVSGWVENQQEEVQERRGRWEGGTRLGVSWLASNLQ